MTLTTVQKAVLEFMCRYIDEHKMPPTVREIAAEFDWTSTNAASCVLDALAKKGYVQRAGGRSRAWRPL